MALVAAVVAAPLAPARAQFFSQPSTRAVWQVATRPDPAGPIVTNDVCGSTAWLTAPSQSFACSTLVPGAGVATGTASAFVDQGRVGASSSTTMAGVETARLNSNVDAQAYWIDRVRVTGAGAAQARYVDLQIQLRGSQRAYANKYERYGGGCVQIADAATRLGFQFYVGPNTLVSPFRDVQRSVLGDPYLCTDKEGSVDFDETTTYRVPLTGGVGLFHYFLQTTGFLFAEYTTGAFGVPANGYAISDYAHTAGVVGLTVVDASGAPITGGVSVAFDNGTVVGPLPLAAVPEPTTLVLLGVGLAGLAAVGRRRRVI